MDHGKADFYRVIPHSVQPFFSATSRSPKYFRGFLEASLEQVRPRRVSRARPGGSPFRDSESRRCKTPVAHGASRLFSGRTAGSRQSLRGVHQDWSYWGFRFTAFHPGLATFTPGLVTLGLVLDMGGALFFPTIGQFEKDMVVASISIAVCVCFCCLF